MLIRWRVAIAVFSLTGLVMLTGALGYATLPWLLWHFLPDAPQRGALVTHDVTDDPLASLAEIVVPPVLREYLPAASHISWAQDGQHIQLIIVPRLQTYQSLPQALTVSGWDVHYRGPLLIATQGEVTLRPLTSVFSGYIHSLTSSSWPVFPRAILVAAQDSFDGVTSPLAVVMTRRDKQVRLVVASDLSEGIRQESAARGESRDRRRITTVPPNDAVMTVSGELLKAFPSELNEQLNRQLRSSLGFTLTRPDVLAQLAEHDVTSLILRAGGEGNVLTTTIAVRGDASTFVETVTGWLQEEERRTRLTTRAFRLPDGTLGFEKVPGEALPVVTYATSDQCWHPVEQRSTLWLCTQADSVGVGTSQAFARDAAHVVSTPTSFITLGAQALEHLQGNLACGDQSVDIQTHIFCSLASLRLQGDSERVHIEFVVR